MHECSREYKEKTFFLLFVIFSLNIEWSQDKADNNQNWEESDAIYDNKQYERNVRMYVLEKAMHTY